MSSSRAPTSCIIDGTDVDLSVIAYTPPKQGGVGGSVVNVLNKHFKESITIAVPLMSSWGAREGMETLGKNPDGSLIQQGTGKFTMSLQFDQGEYATPEMEKFLTQMKRLEEKVKHDALANSFEWFGREIKSMEVIEDKMNPMIKYPKHKGTQITNYDKPPSMTIKIPCWKGVWQSSVFDEEGNPLYVKGKSAPDVTPLDFLTNPNKSTIKVVCLIQAAGIWLTNGKMSITWNLMQCMVCKPKTSLIANDVCLMHISPTDRNALAAAAAEDNAGAAAVKSDPEYTGVYIESDDEDEDEEEEEGTVPASAAAPAPTPVAAAAVPVAADTDKKRSATQAGLEDDAGDKKKKAAAPKKAAK